MSETNKDIAVAFYKKALFEGRVEDAFRLYAVPTYRQHNPLIEDGMEGVMVSNSVIQLISVQTVHEPRFRGLR